MTKRTDLAVREFDQALDEFIPKAKDADVALFFFSGYGVQIDKRGYLAPIDVKAETESSALRELVSIQKVVSRIENAAKVSVIVLDACRDSPLQERFRRIAVEKNKGLVPTKGLPPVSIVGSNTLVVYATVPGETASDGVDRNSPFAAALLRHIETPGLEIEQMFKHVTADVLTATGGKQQPERLSRLQNELVLLPATSGAKLEAPLSADAQAWIAVQSTTSEPVLEEFIRRFPDSPYAGFAKDRLDESKKRRAAELRPENSTAKDASPDFPRFPWPPPNASSRYVLPLSIFGDKNNFGQVSDYIVSNLEERGYVERSFFLADNGALILVTRLERIKQDGTSMQEPDRWVALGVRLRSWVNLFYAEPGYYRVIVFVIGGHFFSLASQICGRKRSPFLALNRS